jgi:hypothetical protein
VTWTLMPREPNEEPASAIGISEMLAGFMSHGIPRMLCYYNGGHHRHEDLDQSRCFHPDFRFFKSEPDAGFTSTISQNLTLGLAVGSLVSSTWGKSVIKGN